MSRLILLTNDYPYRTGDVTFVSQEIDALAERFDEVIVFCNARNPHIETVPMPANVRLGGNFFVSEPEDAPKRLLRPHNVALFLSALCREAFSRRLFGHLKLFVKGARVGLTQSNRHALTRVIDADTVVYAYWGMGGGLALPWIRGARRRVLRVHRYDLYEEMSPERYLPFRPYLYHRADRILAISDDGKRYLESLRGVHVPAPKIVISRLGVAGPETPPRLEHSGETTIVSCSSVIPVKRVWLIGEAVRALAASDPAQPVRWVHFGDGAEMPELRDAVASDPLPNLTIELVGQRNNDELLAYYASHHVDVFVNASESEGIPVSIMEAAAYNIPIVATAVGGTPEIVTGQVGILVPETVSASELAKALQDAVARRAEFDPRSVWAERYDVEQTSRRAAALVAGDQSAIAGR